LPPYPDTRETVGIKEQLMQIRFGTKVLCEDGEEAGDVGGVVVDTDSRQVSHVVLARGKLFAQNWLIPLNMVQGEMGGKLLLYAKATELPQLPQFIPGMLASNHGADGEGSTPTVGQGKAEGHAMAVRLVRVLLKEGSEVLALDGRLGTLMGVRLQLYTDTLSSIAARSDNGEIDVPETWVSEIRPQRIKLAATREQAAGLVGPEAGPYLAVEGNEQRSEEGL
jgi:hypothetical protein